MWLTYAMPWRYLGASPAQRTRQATSLRRYDSPCGGDWAGRSTRGAGSIFLAGIAGLLLSYAIVQPATVVREVRALALL